MIRLWYLCFFKSSKEIKLMCKFPFYLSWKVLSQGLHAHNIVCRRNAVIKGDVVAHWHFQIHSAQVVVSEGIFVFFSLPVSQRTQDWVGTVRHLCCIWVRGQSKTHIWKVTIKLYGHGSWPDFPMGIVVLLASTCPQHCVSACTSSNAKVL